MRISARSALTDAGCTGRGDVWITGRIHLERHWQAKQVTGPGDC